MHGLKKNIKIIIKLNTDSAISACVKLSERYITDKFLPDKAIDVLDEAGAKAHLFNFDVLKKF